MGKGKLPGDSLTLISEGLGEKVGSLVASGHSDQALELLGQVPVEQALQAVSLAGASALSASDVSRYRHLSAALLLPVDPLAARNTLLCDATDPETPSQFRDLAREKLDYIRDNELMLMDAAGRATGGWRHGFPF